MKTRERSAESGEATTRVPAAAETRLDGEALREEGAAFLDAADEAIDRALSGDSEAFLEQNRQLGGQ